MFYFLFLNSSREQVVAASSSSIVCCRRSHLDSFDGALQRRVVIVEDVEPTDDDVLAKAVVSDWRREVDPCTRCLLLMLLLRSARLHIRTARTHLPSAAAAHRRTGVAAAVSAHPAASLSDAVASSSCSTSSSSGQRNWTVEDVSEI